MITLQDITKALPLQTMVLITIQALLNNRGDFVEFMNAWQFGP